MDIKATKTALREQYLARRAAMPPEEKKRREEKICRLILASASFRYAETILAYAPKESEIDIRPVLREALAQEKRLAMPRCEGEHLMTYRYISTLDELAPAAFGLMEPGAEAPAFAEDPGHSSLCLVPGVVFDVHGYRIGYGGGFYDKFLAAEPNHPTLALCYEFQMLPHLETEAHDIPVDYVIWA